MGLSRSEIDVIARSAFLHNVGRREISEAILNKPGKLTPEEMAIMQELPYRGYQLVRRSPMLKEAAEIVYAQRERYDGTGYPRRLKGDEIPLGARIVAVAKTLDSLISDRPYRTARTIEYARAEIQRCSGTQFDPRVVEVFQTMPDEIFEELQRKISEQSEQ